MSNEKMISGAVKDELEDIGMRLNLLEEMIIQLYNVAYMDRLEKADSQEETLCIYHDWIAKYRNLTGSILNNMYYILEEQETRINELI